MNTHVGGTRSARADRVQLRQLPFRLAYGEGADCSFVPVAHAVGFIRSIQASAGGIERKAVGAGPQFKDAAWRQRAGVALHAKEMNAATVSRRQVDLRGQYIAERRAERAHVG